MKMNGMIFLLAFVLAFAGGYFFFSGGENDDLQTVTDSEGTNEKDEKDEKNDGDEEVMASADFEILNTNSCLSCHAVSASGIEGGNTGPDLSKAYEGVEGKHGIDLDKFLQEPTSAVMATVIEANPLSDEDREQIIEVLKKASEN